MVVDSGEVTLRVEPQDLAAVVLEEVDRLADVRVGLAPALPGLEHLECGKLEELASHELRGAEEHGGAFRGRGPTPALEGPASGRHGALRLLQAGVSSGAHDLLGPGRVDRGETLRRVDRLAVDPQRPVLCQSRRRLPGPHALEGVREGLAVLGPREVGVRLVHEGAREGRIGRRARRHALGGAVDVRRWLRRADETLPVFAIPLLLTQFSFRRYATIDATYLQTIRSLSKVTEVGGYTETGHSRRVSRLAVTVGREMGVSQRDLVDLEYAALMHDIGQLSLSTPIPGGTTTILAPVDQRRIAELGADIIRETGVLDRAALIVQRQADPYRPYRGQLDTSLPLESRIIKAVNAYDDFVGASLEGDRKLQAMERLSLQVDRDYDPAVVDTLARIIERQTEYAY